MTETYTAIEYEGDYYVYREDDDTAISFYVIGLLMDLYNLDPDELDRIIEQVENAVARLMNRAQA